MHADPAASPLSGGAVQAHSAPSATPPLMSSRASGSMEMALPEAMGWGRVAGRPGGGNGANKGPHSLMYPHVADNSERAA